MKILLIDDEEPARQLVKIFLKSHADCELVGEAADGFEGFRLIRELQPDVVFLDIQMPRITGFELLELLENPPIIVFATAYDQYAIKAFEKNAADYLLKPFSKERLAQALEKVRQRLAIKQDGVAPEQKIKEQIQDRKELLERIAVKLRNKVQVIPVEDILYFEAEGDYVFLHTADGKFLKEVTMKYLENHLPPDRFIRVHRSAIVHVEAIKGLEQLGAEAWQVILKSGQPVRVSAEGRKQLKRLLGL
jgi:two-component system LytT family response regulator